MRHASKAQCVRAGSHAVHIMWMMRRATSVAFNGFVTSQGRACLNAVRRLAPKGGHPLDYTDRLRRLAVHDQQVVAELICGAGSESPIPATALDARTLALVRLAALVAVGGAVPSYGAHADAAIGAGATAAEIVDVLVAVLPVVGLPCVVAAAPKLALALGHDVDDVFAVQAG
jgi:alkylhydroperoxidase/carboxymuconolactone decarboxylase family protein YurZ